MKFARLASLVEILKRSNIKLNSLEKFAGNFYLNMSPALLSTIDLILDRYEDYSKELSENKNIRARVDSYEIPIEDFFNENHMEFVRKVFPEGKKVRLHVNFLKEGVSEYAGSAQSLVNDQRSEIVDLCIIKLRSGQNRSEVLNLTYHELTHCAQYVSGSGNYSINNKIYNEESNENTQFNNKSFGMPHSTRKKFRSRNRQIQEALGESFYEHDLSTEKYVILIQDGRYLVFFPKENPLSYLKSSEDIQNNIDLLKLLCVRSGDGMFKLRRNNNYDKEYQKRYIIKHQLRSGENFTNASTYCQRKFVEIANGFKDSYIEFKTEHIRGDLCKNIARIITYFLTKEFRVIYRRGRIRSSSTIRSEIARLIGDMREIGREGSDYSDLKVENPEQYERAKDIFSRIISHILVYQDHNFLLKVTEDASFISFRNQDFASQLKEKLKRSFKPLVDKRISHVVEESKRFAENMFEYINSEVTEDSSFEESADPYSKMIIDNIIAGRGDRDDRLESSLREQKRQARQNRRERLREEARAKFERYNELYGKPREEKSRRGYQRSGIPVPDDDESNK